MTIVKRKWAFTLIELILWMALFSIGLVAIIQVITYGLTFVDRSRQDIIAINLAREWMEWMNAIRWTNWLYRSANKDQCWLKKNPLLTGNWTNKCEDDDWIQSWVYIIDQQTIWDESTSFFLSWWAIPLLDITNNVTPDSYQSRLCFSDTDKLRSPCPWDTIHIDPEWFFFRQVQVKWLYRKDTGILWWESLVCTNGEDQAWACGDAWAKELHYCVLVQYQKQVFGEVELCGMMTNFEE